MADARDERFMRRALALAERGWGQTAPNPLVGAVVVRDGLIVGEGWHARLGAAHAEVAALAGAGALARGATIYVTLEPCNHWGRTPPCVDALLDAGVARVVAATMDPGAESCGGATRLRAAGVEVETGVCEAEAREANAPFLFAARADRPWVTLKLAVSLDGALADVARRPAWLTGPAARAEVHRMRAAADAVAVGARTYLADRPRLTVRDVAAPRVQPRRVVFDRSGLIAPGDLPADDGAPSWTIVRDRDTRRALRGLAAEGVRALLVEGGAGLAASLLDADLVDRLVIFQAPVILGAGALPAFAAVAARPAADAPRYPVVRREAFGDDLMTIHALHAV